MDVETYKMLLVVAGSLISLLLVVIGYFLNKHIQVIESLVTAVNSLNLTVKLLQHDHENSTSSFLKDIASLEANMKLLSDKLERHELLHSQNACFSHFNMAPCES